MGLELHKTGLTIAASTTVDDEYGISVSGAVSFAVGGETSTNCTVTLQGSLDGTNWVDAMTLTTTNWATYTIESGGVRVNKVSSSTSLDALPALKYVRVKIANGDALNAFENVSIAIWDT